MSTIPEWPELNDVEERIARVRVEDTPAFNRYTTRAVVAIHGQAICLSCGAKYDEKWGELPCGH